MNITQKEEQYHLTIFSKKSTKSYIFITKSDILHFLDCIKYILTTCIKNNETIGSIEVRIPNIYKCMWNQYMDYFEEILDMEVDSIKIILENESIDIEIYKNLLQQVELCIQEVF